MATGGPSKSTVFINEVAFEVAAMPFNVREAFGNDTVLIHSSGQPVRTNEWGVTLQPLQHGSFYYLVRNQRFKLMRVIRVNKNKEIRLRTAWCRRFDFIVCELYVKACRINAAFSWVADLGFRSVEAEEMG